MQDLKRMLGIQLARSVTRFLSTSSHQTFQQIKANYQRLFVLKERVQVGVALALILRRSPQWNTVKARLVALYFLHNAFLSHLPIWKHPFGVLFILLIHNKPSWSNGYREPLREVERTFLLHLLAVPEERLFNLTPAQLLSAPNVMSEVVDLQRYERLAIYYAMHSMDVRPSIMYASNSAYGFIEQLRSTPSQEEMSGFTLNADIRENSDCTVEDMTEWLVYRYVMLNLFPFDESFFIPGGVCHDSCLEFPESIVGAIRNQEDTIFWRPLIPFRDVDDWGIRFPSTGLVSSPGQQRQQNDAVAPVFYLPIASPQVTLTLVIIVPIFYYVPVTRIVFLGGSCIWLWPF
uniref:Uncharacterized protein n=1 Tax=Trichuris muris TaxID=70415 RepID=A0A5S6R342_TRIMR